MENDRRIFAYLHILWSEAMFTNWWLYNLLAQKDPEAAERMSREIVKARNEFKKQAFGYLGESKKEKQLRRMLEEVSERVSDLQPMYG